MQFHPYAESFPLLEGTEYEEFRADIAANGVRDPIKYRIVDGKKQGLDGRNRLRACDELQIACPEERVNVSDDAVEAYIDSLNFLRRHLNQKQQQEKRQERIKRVAEARTQGKSQREIAESEGVSPSQVRDDLKKATAQGCAVDPPRGKVTGKDGREKPATTKVLCKACQHRQEVGKPLIKDCEECKKAQKAKKKKPKPEPKKSDSTLPKSVQNALADTWHAECARLLSKIRTECKAAFSWSSWLDAAVLDHLKAAQECFTTAIPRKVCPECKGQKTVEGKSCQRCRQGGYLASQV